MLPIPQKLARSRWQAARQLAAEQQGAAGAPWRTNSSGSGSAAAAGGGRGVHTVNSSPALGARRTVSDTADAKHAKHGKQTLGRRLVHSVSATSSRLTGEAAKQSSKAPSWLVAYESRASRFARGSSALERGSAGSSREASPVRGARSAHSAGAERPLPGDGIAAPSRPPQRSRGLVRVPSAAGRLEGLAGVQADPVLPRSHTQSPTSGKTVTFSSNIATLPARQPSRPALAPHLYLLDAPGYPGYPGDAPASPASTPAGSSPPLALPHTPRRPPLPPRRTDSDQSEAGEAAARAELAPARPASRLLRSTSLGSAPPPPPLSPPRSPAPAPGRAPSSLSSGGSSSSSLASSAEGESPEILLERSEALQLFYKNAEKRGSQRLGKTTSFHL